MINFKSVTFKNLLSFGDREITIKLNEHKTTLISGDSGSGKSSMIVEAITFALFGKSFRKIKKGDLINTVNGKDLLVNVIFCIGESEYNIVRGMKPEIFEIFKDGVLVNQNPNVRDYQKYLEENILRMSYKTWTSIVVLGFANHTPFMLLSAHERRQMVDEVLGVEAFQKMYEVAKSKASETKSLIATLTNQAESLRDSITLQKKNFKAIQEQESAKERNIESEIEVISKQISELVEANNSIDGSLDPLLEKTSDLQTLTNKKNEFVQLLSKLRYRRNQLSTMLEFFNENSVCPTCKQEINDDYKETIEKKESSTLHELENGIKALEEKASSIDKEIGSIEKIMDQISKLEMKKALNLKDITNLQQSITSKQNELSKTVHNENSLAKQIAANIVELSNKVQQINEEKSKLTDQLRHIVFCQGLLKEDGIKGKIIDMYLPVLTKLVNDFLEAMGFHMRLVFDSGFNETIYARYRDKLSFTQLSQGEQSRITLSIILAWRSLAQMRNSVEVSILILDELLDSAISAADAEVVMELVREINKNQNIFIISHQPEAVKAFADASIHVHKKGNFSQLEY